MHASSHIYVEHVVGLFTRGVKYPMGMEVGMDSEEEKGVVEVDCLSYDDDEEVQATK